jgi:hypothetical protein
MVVVEPSHEPLDCAMSSVVDDEEDDDVADGEEGRGGEERPPVAQNRLRGGGVLTRKLRLVRVRALAGVHRWERALRGKAKEEERAARGGERRLKKK